MTAKSNTPLLSATGLSKRYGSFYALRNVSLEVYPGEVVAVMGENGAGKSTLMKLLAGVESPSEGMVQVNVDGGVSTVPQEIDLAHDRSVADNIFMGIEPGSRWFPARQLMVAKAGEVLSKIGSDMTPKSRTGDLDSASKQMVLIARALARNSRVVIFDEPTANLSPKESESLFHVIRDLKQRGTGILYVSHRIPEVMDLSDRILVLRDGVQSGSWKTADINERQVVSSMVGREVDLLTRLEQKEWSGEPSLVVSGLVSPDVGPVSLEVHPGQVLGVAGLPDSGRDGLLKAIYGAAHRTAGQVLINGHDIGHSGVAGSIRQGVVYLPGERRASGIFPKMSVKHNITSLIIGRHTRFGLLKSQELGESGRKFAKAVNVRAASLELPITALSGGNQQKALLARLLAASPKVMLLDEPTRGVDVGAKAEVYEVMNQLTERGMAVVLSSSDLPELLNQCHQIAVMFRGAVVALLDASSTSEEEIMAYATTGHPIEELE